MTLLSEEATPKETMKRRSKAQAPELLSSTEDALLGAAMPLLKRLPLRTMWFLNSPVSGCSSLGISFAFRNMVSGLQSLRIPSLLSRNTYREGGREGGGRELADCPLKFPQTNPQSCSSIAHFQPPQA